MDTLKLIFFFVLIPQSGFALSQSVFDMGEHSGIIRGSTGNYSQVSANGSVRSLTSNTALALIEKPIIQTSKGAIEVALSRSVSVDVARLGSTVAGIAKSMGPVGLTVTAVSLVCELTTICTQAGEWMMQPESALNDARFTPELYSGGYPIPVGTPALTGSPVTAPLGSTTKTLKDGAGNVTGTEVTTDSLSITDGATSENPNRINLTQTTITNNYNTSNVLTSSSTTVTDPQQPKTDGIEIEIDNMQDQPLEQQAIPGLFTHTSWGSGSCPGDRSVSYHYGTLNLTFQPACDAAIALQPLVVILAGIAALFIISGAVRND